MKIFNNASELVAEGIVSNHQVGEELGEQSLQPGEVRITISFVFKLETPVLEAFIETLRECIHCTIRWARHSVMGPTTTTEENVILEATRMFRCAEDTPILKVNGGQGAPPTGRSSNAIPSIVESNNIPIAGFPPPVHEGFPHEAPPQLYDMAMRERHERRTAILGERRHKNMTSHSVEVAVIRSKCAAKCMSKLTLNAILNHHMYAWMSP